MTKKEKIRRNIGLTFDLLRQIVEAPEMAEKIPNDSILEFVEKDFVTPEKATQKSKRKYLRVISQLDGL